MTHNLTSRRLAAGRSSLLAAALCLVFFPTAFAQHGGGGGGRPMGAPGMGMSGPSGNMREGNPAGADTQPFNRSAQPRMGLQLGLSGRWWDDHHTAHQLKLSSDQQQRMDNIFEANKPTLANLAVNLQHEEINLASLSSSDLKDENKVFEAIDRVSHARSDLEKQYAHMLLQVRQQLDPQQLETLDRQIANSH